MSTCPQCWTPLEGRLIQTAAGLACPTCGQVIHFALAMASQPNTTPQVRSAWQGVAVLALMCAAAVAIDHLLDL